MSTTPSAQFPNNTETLGLDNLDSGRIDTFTRQPQVAQPTQETDAQLDQGRLDTFFRQDERIKQEQLAAKQSAGLSSLPNQQGKQFSGPLDLSKIQEFAASEGLTTTQAKVMGAILAQESGGNLNIGNSIDGAKGAGQIMPGTFKQYAKQGESIDNPRDNLAVMARIVKDLGARSGDDAAKIATGYFSGAGNINAKEGNAWKNDAADGNGKRVSSYVSDVMSRIGGANELSQQQPTKQDQPKKLAADSAPKWSAIIQKPAYKEMSKEDKQGARQAYFDEFIAPDISQANMAQAQQWFNSEADKVEPMEKGLMDRAKETAQALFAGRSLIAPAIADVYDTLAGTDRSGKSSALPSDPSLGVMSGYLNKPKQVEDKYNPNVVGFKEASKNQAIYEKESKRIAQMGERGNVRLSNAEGRKFTAMGDERTGGEIAGDVFNSAAKIIPTALKGVADIASMVTGDKLGSKTSDYLQSEIEKIDKSSSQRLQYKKTELNYMLQNGQYDKGDVVGFILTNPGAFSDEAITQAGSMLLPAGAAKGAVSLASQLGKGAKFTKKAAMLATYGTVAAQNAADTFKSLEGLSLEDRYRGAAVSAAVSLLAGIATKGGANGVIARLIAGEFNAGKIGFDVVKSFIKTTLKEGGQEATEEFGNALGEAIGKNESLDGNAVAKRMAYAGTLGAVMGGVVDLGVNTANVASAAPAPQLNPQAQPSATQQQAPQPTATQQPAQPTPQTQQTTAPAPKQSAAQPSTSNAIDDQAITDYAESRMDMLREKRDGISEDQVGEDGKVVSVDIAGKGLTKAEASEMAALEEAAGDTAKLAELYGLNENVPKDEISIIDDSKQTKETTKNVSESAKVEQEAITEKGAEVAPVEQGDKAELSVAENTQAEKKNEQFDIKHSTGFPFRTIEGANNAQKKHGGEVTQVDGGYVVRVNGDTSKTNMQQEQTSNLNKLASKAATSQAKPLPKPKTEKETIQRKADKDATFKKINAKLIPDMTDAELKTALDVFPADHKRIPKIKKEIEKRGISSINEVAIPKEVAKVEEYPFPQKQKEAAKPKTEKEAKGIKQAKRDSDGDLLLGKNADGNAVYQDKNGVRSYVTNGIRISEIVSIVLDNNGTGIKKQTLKDEFKTTEELAESSPNTKDVAIDTPNTNKRSDLDSMFDDVLADELRSSGKVELTTKSTVDLSSSISILPTKFSDAIEKDLGKQKTKLQRLRREALESGIALEEKLRRQEKVKNQEKEVRTARQSIFTAEDNALKALKENNLSAFDVHKGQFLGAFELLANTISGTNLKPKTEKEAIAQRTTKQAAISAAKNTAEGLSSAVDGLGALFGSKNKGTFGSGPVINEETYTKAKPLFQAAVANFGQAGTDIKEVMRAVVRMVLDKFGVDTVANMKPYIVKFVGEYEQGTQEAQASNLIDHLYNVISKEGMPKDNIALKKIVSSYDGKEVTQGRLKQAQEDIEAAIARVARDIVNKGDDVQTTFNALTDLYASQPNLNIRTSTSVENQAYSTPAPLAYLAAELAGITQQNKVYEPTAGNGMLLITANPKNATANELEDQRFSNLQSQGFNATQGDALKSNVKPKSQDAVITNPPFGSVKDANGKATKVLVDDYKIGKIDHLIAAKALETMKDDGKATLILGADKVTGGISTDDRIFFNWLHSNYNVVGSFEVDGKLYNRQGAGWPVRVITINGRQKSNKVSPLEGTIERANSWSQVYEQYQKSLVSSNTNGRQPQVGVSGGRQSNTGNDLPTVYVADGKKTSGNGGGQPTGSKGGTNNVGGTRTGVVSDSNASKSERLGGTNNADGRNAESNLKDQLGEGKQGGAEKEPAGGRSELLGNNGNDSLTDGENQFQVKYVPRSARKDEGVLIPVNMRDSTQDALSQLEDEVGDLDQFAAKELGYKNTNELHNALMGLQVDSVAMAINQINKGKGVIIADQTGIGKGRQAAAIIRWAAKNGHVPIFVTVKPQLFTDMYGDLADIGTNDINPFILNSDENISGPNGEKLFSNKKSAHKGVMERLYSTGQLPEGTNAVFMTYSQINKDNLQRKVISSLADKAVFVLDESHNAGGQSATGEFIAGVLSPSKGVVYLSATFAKRPDNMPLYFKTDIGMTIGDDNALMEAMLAGGLPLQTVVSNNLVKAGQMFRRERSYDGVSIETIVDDGNRDAHEKLSDSVTQALRSIVDADRAFHEIFFKEYAEAVSAQGGALKDIAGNQAEASVNHTEFSSVVHNFIRQLLLGLKADAAGVQAIKALKEGKKPIIAVENTMGSFLNEYAASKGIVQGGPLGNFSYRDVLSRALDRSRHVVKKDEKGNEVKEYIPLSQLDRYTKSVYAKAQKTIDALDLDIPVSPIDWMRQKLKNAGYSVAEITGRKMTVDYSTANKPLLSSLSIEEQNDKVATTRKFNSGELDALILNVAGSTGISLHASGKFKDKRPRHMIVAQAAQDINVFMQMLGRIHRTGQVELPSYEILNVDLPAEKRPTSLLAKKMKSLNANTSSNTESATSVKAQDMMNKYGDMVVAQYLDDNVSLAKALDLSGALDKNGNAELDVARKFTGKLALMPVELQKRVYADIEDQYSTLIDYLNKTNQNELEPKTFDFDAKLMKQDILYKGTNSLSPFGADAIYNEFSIKAQGIPMTPDEIRKVMGENLDNKSSNQHASELVAIMDENYQKYIDGIKKDVNLANDINYEGTTSDENKQINIAAIAQAAGKRFINSHAIGQSYRVEINGEIYNAAVINIKSNHKTGGNPYSLSKIQVTLALNGSLRSVTVPASQFKKIEVAYIGGRIESLFEEKPRNERDLAKIITGNLLGAYGEIKDSRGTIINFTKEDGTVGQGILLPKIFDFKENTKGDYMLQSAGDALKFIGNSTNKDIAQIGIASRDNVVRVTPLEGGGITITVPKSKVRGGKFFLDKVLTDIAGDFVSKGGLMSVEVPKRKAESALTQVMRKTALYAAPSMAGEARQMVAPESKGDLAFSKAQPFQTKEEAKNFTDALNIKSNAVEVDGGWLREPKLISTEKELNESKAAVKALNKALTDLGMATTKALSKAPSKAHAMAKALGKVFSTDVHIIENTGDFDGVAQNGVVFVADDMRQPTLAIVGHEVTHVVEQSNSELGKKLRSLMRNYLKDGVVESRQRKESPTFGDMVSTQYAEGEVLADIGGAMWMDSKFWSDMYKSDKNLFRQVAYKFMEAATKAINILTGSRFDVSQLVKDVSAVRDIYVSVFTEFNQGNDLAKFKADTSLAMSSTEQTAEDALSDISNMEEIFRYKKSEGKTIESIVSDIDERIEVQKFTNIPGETLYKLTLPDQTVARIMVRPFNKNGSIYGYELDNNNEITDQVTERPGKFPEEVYGKEDVLIDVSLLNEGGGFGSKLYHIAANYAFNTGRVFIGDPAGMTHASMIRRPEQMLSSALKFGTTEHLAPHPKQIKGNPKTGIAPIDWIYGDHEGNIKKLVDATVKNIDNAGGIGDIDYDKRSGEFNDSTGSGITREDLYGLAKVGLARAAQAGGATLARYAFSSSFLQSLREELARGRTDGIMVRLRKQLRDHVSAVDRNGSLNQDGKKESKQLYYSKPDDAGYIETTERAQQELIKELGSPKFKSIDWWDKSVGTMFNVAEKNPHFKKAFDLLITRENTVSLTSIRAAELAPGFLPRVDDFKSAAKTLLAGQKNSKQRDLAANAIYEGTLHGDNVLEGVVFNPQELQTMGLDREGIALYFQARSAIDASLTEVAAAECFAALQAFIPKSVRAQIIQSPRDAENILTGAIEKRIALDEKRMTALLRKGADQETIDSMEQDIASAYDAQETATKIFEHASLLKEAGYAPLMRFGKFFVSVEEVDPATGKTILDDEGKPNTIFFGRYETEGEAQEAYFRQSNLNGNNDGMRVLNGIVNDDKHKLFEGISPETIALFGEALGDKFTTNKLYQEAISERSALKRRLGRNSTEGFSKDMPRVLSNFITSNGRYAAGRYYTKDINNAVKYIPREKGDVQKEVMALKEYVDGGQDVGMGAMASGLAFTWFLGGNIASAAINATQTATMTFPYLSQFGAKNASASLTKAFPYAIGKKQITDNQLREALKRAGQEGKVDAQEIFHLYTVGIQGVAAALNGKMSKLPLIGKHVKGASESGRARMNALLTLWGMPFAMVEGFNRRLTFIAAWDIAKEKGEIDPYSFAARAVDETQGVYNKVNRPKWARTSVGRVVFTFAQFRIMNVELLKRMATKGGPEGKKAAMIYLAVLIMTAGLAGLPYADDVDDIIDTFGQMLGYDTNMKRTKREWALGTLGKFYGELALYGMSSQLPMDFGSRMGLGNMLPGTGVAKLSNKDRVADELLDVGGAVVGGLGKQFAEAVGNANKGNYVQAGFGLMPTAIKNAAAGIDMMATGKARDTKDREKTDVTLGEGALKAAGFNPTKIANMNRVNMPIYQDLSLQKIAEANIVDKWARGIVHDNLQTQNDAADDLEKWNRKNPKTPISITARQITSKVKTMMTPTEDRLRKSIPKEMRESVSAGLDSLE